MSDYGEDAPELFGRLGVLETEVAHIKTSLDNLDKISQQLDTFMKQQQGAARLIQLIFYVLGPLVAAIYWIKEHVK